MLLIDGIIFNIQKSVGGISIYFDNLLEQYNNLGFNYNLFLYNDSKKIDNVRIKKLNPRLFERYRDFVAPNKGGVFHSSYYRSPEDKKLKSIVTVHDFTYELYRSGISRGVHSWQKNKSILGAERVVCISESTRRDLLRHVPGVDERKVSVIYNAASDDYKFLNNGGKRYEDVVIFVGARGGYKNFESAILAVSNLKDLRLGVVGGGNISKKEKHLLDKYLNNRYLIFGSKTNSDLNILYNECYGLLYPSRYEGFGIPILEAMKSGCPFVAMRSSSIPEVAGGAGILVEDDNPVILSEAIRQIGRSEMREKMIRIGFDQAKKFSWKKSASEIICVYEGIL